jgi:hypothetical protein
LILLAALVLGLLAGWGWARWRRQAYRAPELRSLWLVPAAFLPQFVVTFPPITKNIRPDLAAAALPVSLLVFLAFVWINRRLPGMPVLLTGLILNMVVITANGGWMPISPETASHLRGGDAVQFVSPGSRYGQKDILLLPEATRFEFLSDRFLVPDWVHYPVAFSLGDALVAIGAFWLLARPLPKPNSMWSEPC